MWGPVPKKHVKHAHAIHIDLACAKDFQYNSWLQCYCNHDQTNSGEVDLSKLRFSRRLCVLLQSCQLVNHARHVCSTENMLDKCAVMLDTCAVLSFLYTHFRYKVPGSVWRGA